VENIPESPQYDDNRDRPGGKPPGQFVSDELEEQTARFIEAVKVLARRREERQSEERPGPPPRGGDQRSSRR